jgi:release factor glutamine methyltransferase
MRSPEFVVIALPDDAVLVHNDTPNQWIGPCESQTFPRQLQTTPHVYFILLCQPDGPLLLFLIMLQNHATLKEVRLYLHRELLLIYPEGETSSMIPLIMEHCGFPSPVYLLEPTLAPGPETIAQINEIVIEIHTHRPIQYILGHTTFCELAIMVNENVLIPRPETEEMVYRIMKSKDGPPSMIIDLGTGSGCIALALKKHFQNAMVSGIELSEPALDLARRNGFHNELDVEWIQGDMLDPGSLDLHRKYDLVVSNPPYVLAEEQDQMERNVLDYEPYPALFVQDNDPLKYYRAISTCSCNILSAGGTLWVEINERFGADTSRLLEEAGLKKITIHKDIHEKERFIQAGK